MSLQHEMSLISFPLNFVQLSGLLSLLLALHVQPAPTEGQGPPCLPGVDRFASRSGLDFFYHCDRPGGQAVEVQCPSGQLFSRKGSRCIASEIDEIKVAA